MLPNWWCRTCKRGQRAIIEHGQTKTRIFPNGYHAVYLICGHKANANRDSVSFDSQQYYPQEAVQ